MSTQHNTAISKDDQPAIYVGTYAKYNNGSLFGRWMNPLDYADESEFEAACFELHSDEEDPELMFQDYENMPEQYISESHLDPDFWEYHETINNSHLDSEVFAAAMELGIPVDSVEDAYQGQYNSNEDFAMELAESCGFEQPDSWPYNCIDWERAARDLMYDYRCSNGHYFSSNW